MDNKEALVPFGVSNELLQSLANSTENFKEAAASPRNKIAKRSAGGKTIDAGITAADKILKEQIKKLMPGLKKTYPDVYNAFIINSKIVDAPGISMEKHHSEKPFIRYADDIVVHCKTEKQARYVLAMIRKRFVDCKLTLHPMKTRIINMRDITKEKYPRSFDFLGFTFKPYWSKTAKGYKVLITIFISQKSKSNVLDKLRRLQLHKRRKPLEALAKLLNPITRGVINYYCKVWSSHTWHLWNQLNYRLLKWVKWEKGLYTRSALRWLQTKYREKPGLFYHWKIVHP